MREILSVFVRLYRLKLKTSIGTLKMYTVDRNLTFLWLCSVIINSYKLTDKKPVLKSTPLEKQAFLWYNKCM